MSPIRFSHLLAIISLQANCLPTASPAISAEVLARSDLEEYLNPEAYLTRTKRFQYAQVNYYI